MFSICGKKPTKVYARVTIKLHTWHMNRETSGRRRRIRLRLFAHNVLLARLWGIPVRIQLFKPDSDFQTGFRCCFFTCFEICLTRWTLTLKNADYIKRMRIRILTLWPDPFSFGIRTTEFVRYGSLLVFFKRNLGHKVPGALYQINRIMNLILIESGRLDIGSKFCHRN